MKLVRRSSWGARHGRGPTNIKPSDGGVAVHYLGPGHYTGHKHKRCAARIRAIESQHVKDNGWDAIAYNFLACEHGYVFEGRGLKHRSAAQGTKAGNDKYYAVCALIGSKDTPGDKLKTAIRDAIRHCRRHGAASRVKGHRDFKSTSCPGDRLYDWIRDHGPDPTAAPDSGEASASRTGQSGAAAEPQPDAAAGQSDAAAEPQPGRPALLDPLLRTVVPAAIGAGLGQAAYAGLDLSTGTAATGTVTVAATAAYYTLGRLLERRWPVLGRILLSVGLVKGQPEYGAGRRTGHTGES